MKLDSLRVAKLALAFGVACVLESFFTIEWSYPYCSNPDSGPAYPVMGMPMPYTVFGGVSSLEYIFMPHVYAANLLLLTAFVYPVSTWLVRSKLRAKVAGAAGLAGAGFAGVLLALGLGIGALIPVGSIADGGFMRYEELRPVALGFYPAGMDRCKPSRFWFPQGWRPR